MTQATMGLFQSTLQKTDQWLNELMQHTGRHDEHKTWAMLRSVLHVLRDRLRIEQCAHLSAQLPMMIRGLYFEGWRGSSQPIKLRNRADFVQAVGNRLSDHPEIDPNQAIEAVFFLLTKHISAGELGKIKKELSPEIRELWPGE